MRNNSIRELCTRSYVEGDALDAGWIDDAGLMLDDELYGVNRTQ